MDWNEFVEVVRELGDTGWYSRYAPDGLGDGGTLEYRWVTGGTVTGWGGEEPTARGSEDEPKEWALDAILERVCPRITYLHFRQIEAALKSDTTTEYGYYGDRTTYSIRQIGVRELYNLLVEMGEL